MQAASNQLAMQGRPGIALHDVAGVMPSVLSFDAACQSGAAEHYLWSRSDGFDELLHAYGLVQAHYLMFANASERSARGCCSFFACVRYLFNRYLLNFVQMCRQCTNVCCQCSSKLCPTRVSHTRVRQICS